jgi:hypothetical protein
MKFRAFHLRVDLDDPKRNKKCKDKNGDAEEIPKEHFDDMLASGKLASLGSLYTGDFISISSETTPGETKDKDIEPLAIRCIVVFVGGSAYRICLDQ